MPSIKNRKSPDLKIDKAISPSKFQSNINIGLEGYRILEQMPSFAHYHEDGNNTADMKYHQAPNYSFKKSEKILK